MDLISTEELTILSSVGGGPMARLAFQMSQHGTRTGVQFQFDPSRWRRAMASGVFHRSLARLFSAGLFPIRTVLRACVGHQDTLVPSTNPFLLPWVLTLFRPFHGKRVVPLVYDLYPDALEASGTLSKDSLLSRAMVGLNRYVFRKADGVVFIGPRMAQHSLERYGTPRRWTVIPTGASASEFSWSPTEPFTPETELEIWCSSKELLVGYVGNMGLMHDWETLAEAIVEQFKQDDSHRLGFVLVGSGPGAAKLQAACAHLSPRHVRCVQPLDDRAWARLLRLCQVSVVTLRPEAHLTCVPSKAFSAMAARNAILAIGPGDSDLVQMVNAHHCGRAVEPGRSPDVIEQLQAWLSDPERLAGDRRRAHDALVAEYDMPRLSKKWVAFVEACGRPKSRARQIFSRGTKRLADLVASIVVLTLTTPVLVFVALAIRITMGSPVLFRQKRPGRNAEPFQLLKFRTMRHPLSGEVGPEADGDRITGIGTFLRATSIDELPTLMNVLKGEMSLVGPRPLLLRYLPRYTERQLRRHEAKPGITGFAQVSGRNAISWEAKFEHDVWYVDHQSTLLDLKILLATIGRVIRREGISQALHATMPEFMGSRDGKAADTRDSNPIQDDGVR